MAASANNSSSSTNNQIQISLSQQQQQSQNHAQEQLKDFWPNVTSSIKTLSHVSKHYHSNYSLKGS
jgi:hypothetical protein